MNATTGEESRHGDRDGRMGKMLAASSVTDGTGWATMAAAAVKSKLVSFNLAGPSRAKKLLEVQITNWSQVPWLEQELLMTSLFYR